jgi:hypothetical protein
MIIPEIGNSIAKRTMISHQCVLQKSFKMIAPTSGGQGETPRPCTLVAAAM